MLKEARFILLSMEMTRAWDTSPLPCYLRQPNRCISVEDRGAARRAATAMPASWTPRPERSRAPPLEKGAGEHRGEPVDGEGRGEKTATANLEPAIRSASSALSTVSLSVCTPERELGFPVQELKEPVRLTGPEPQRPAVDEPFREGVPHRPGRGERAVLPVAHEPPQHGVHEPGHELFLFHSPAYSTASLTTW